MPNRSPSRLNRGPRPPKAIRPHNYREVAFDALTRDFGERCAYSMIHQRFTGGVLEVDHFNPRLKKKNPQPYANLLLASPPCNRAKGETWPSKKEQDRGIRFLDPSVEQDYGEHIFEDPKTHHLVGTTPAGRYQIIHCDLNSDHLVYWRALRARLQEQSQQSMTWLHDNYAEAATCVQSISEFMTWLIPEIPAPPKKQKAKKGS